jgi:hypothetical protein
VTSNGSSLRIDEKMFRVGIELALVLLHCVVCLDLLQTPTNANPSSPPTPSLSLQNASLAYPTEVDLNTEYRYAFAFPRRAI